MFHKAMFPDLPEFALIQSILKHSDGILRPQTPTQRSWLGPGDDCAQFDGWLTTLDMSVEGTHFRLDWSTPEEAVEKCLLSNLSDMNAMGGVAKLAFLGLCLSKNWSPEVCSRVAVAFASRCKFWGIQLLGGDTVVAEHGCFSVTLLGTTGHAPLLRSGAKPGQDIYMAGKLGDSSAGLWLLQHAYSLQSAWAQELVALHRVPKPPLALGPLLAPLTGVGGCLDLSDGLSSELHHLALSSGVCLRIEERLIPISPSLGAFCASTGQNAREFWLNGGEDYGLLFTCDPQERVILQSLLLDGELHQIGSVLPGQGVELLTVKGELEHIKAAAWSHL